MTFIKVFLISWILFDYMIGAMLLSSFFVSEIEKYRQVPDCDKKNKHSYHLVTHTKESLLMVTTFDLRCSCYPLLFGLVLQHEK